MILIDNRQNDLRNIFNMVDVDQTDGKQELKLHKTTEDKKNSKKHSVNHH